MSTEYELATARWSVRVAVMDLVAFDQHDWTGASDSAHSDYPDDQFDEALKKYAEAYQATKLRGPLEAFRESLEASEGFAEPRLIVSPASKSEVVEFLENGFNRRAD